MSGLRRGSSVSSSATSASAQSLRTQTPQDGAAGAVSTSRVPRAFGLVGVGVGPADAGFRTATPAGIGGAGALFDLSSVFSWRGLIVLLAVGYIVGWHVTLPGVGRVRI